MNDALPEASESEPSLCTSVDVSEEYNGIGRNSMLINPWRWCTLFLIAKLLSGAAPEQYSHRTWRIDDGLPQNRIRAITQTADGYLWIGTSEGLARFDGVRFTVFHHANTPELRDDSILTLCTTRDGSLWAGTEGGGLVRYSGGSFQYFGPGQGLTNGFVRVIYEDAGKTLWAGTDRGFFRLNGSAFVRLDGTPEIPLASVYSMAQGSDGVLWARSNLGLLTVTGGKLRRGAHDCVTPPVRNLAESRRGFVWALRANGAGRIDNGCPVPDRTLPDVAMQSLIEAKDGDIWIGTGGMGLMRLKNGGLTRFQAPSVLPDNSVNAVYEDHEENIWVGCDDGLVRLRRSRVSTIGDTEGLNDDNVQTVFAAKDGALWMAALTGQLYRSSGAAIQRFRLPAPADGLLVRTIFEDRAGAMWFGTFRGGLIHLVKGKATVYTKKDGLRSNIVRQLLQDPSGNLWIGLESGFSRWNGSGFRNYYLEDGLSYPSTRCMIVDRRGDVLVGTDSGLNRVHNGEIVPDAEFGAVAKEKIWAIHEDPQGSLWLGTRGGGLLRLRNGTLTRFTTKNGLPSDTVYQILTDDAGKFWMSSSSGIFAVDPHEFDGLANNDSRLINVIPYGTAYGMRTTQMNGGFQPAATKAPSGELWFASVRGAVGIDPSASSPRWTPPVVFERLIVDDVPVPISGGISLPPGVAKLEIDFTLCDLVAPEHTGFQYKLEGFETNWTAALRARSAYYTNLKPGHYRFRVRANDSSSSVSEASLSFTLGTRFYKAGWFYGLAVCVLGSMVWGGLVLYARQTRSRYALLMHERLAERNRLAREMHDTVIQGCVGVSTLLDAASGFQSVDTARAHRLLHDAREQITKTLEEARQAIWDLRYAPVANASITMLFDLARKLGSEHHIEIETESLCKGEVDPETDRTLLLVGREALRNAVLHACPMKITIRISVELSEVTLEVTDDGVGFVSQAQPDKENRHFGMIGMRERVQKSGGQFLIRSAPNQGTRIIARIPLSNGERANQTRMPVSQLDDAAS